MAQPDPDLEAGFGASPASAAASTELSSWLGTPMWEDVGLSTPKMKAAFQNTFVGAAMAGDFWKERILPTDETPLNLDQLSELIDKNDLWEHSDSFISVRTMGEFNAKANDIRRETANREVQQDAGLLSNLGYGLIAGAASPENWIPIGRTASLYKAGAGALRTAAETGLAFGAFQAAQEPFLHTFQQTRTLADSVESMAAATVIGGFIGAAPAAIRGVMDGAAGRIAVKLKDEMTGWLRGIDYNQEYLEFAKASLDAINDEILKNPMGRMMQGGTRAPSVRQLAQQKEAVDLLQLAEQRIKDIKDNSIATAGPLEFTRTLTARMAGYFHPGFLDPQRFIFKDAASLEARKGYELMNEVNLLLNKNIVTKSSTGDAQATAQAATTSMEKFHGGWANFYGDLWGDGAVDAAKSKVGFGRSAYAEARQNGYTGSADDFSKSVSLAVARGYKDPNPGIQRAAESFRDNIAEPIRQLTIKAGYPDPGPSPRFAMGWLPRHYVIPAVRGADGKGTEFKTHLFNGFFQEKMDELRAAAAQSGQPVTKQQIGIARRSAKTITEDVYGTITRDGKDGIDARIDLSATQSGNPFEKRVVPIPDEILLEKGWTSADITHLADYAVRGHVPQLLYAERFKTPTGNPDPSLANSLIPKITAEYNELLGKAVSGEARDKLNAERDRVIEVIKNRRDGFFVGPGFDFDKNVAPKMEKLIRNTMTYQAMRSLSNLLVSSLPDVAGLQIHHGLGPQLMGFLNDITRLPIFKNTKFEGAPRELVKQELTSRAAAIEWFNNAGMASHMEMNIPYGQQGRTERAFNNLAKTFSVANGSIHWNDGMKAIAHRVADNRILAAAEKGWANLPNYEKQFLANHGIDGTNLDKIKNAWQSQSQLHDGFLRWGQTTTWADREAAELLDNAVAKNRASTVITPKTGDKAIIWETNPVARLIGQFQSFVASHTLRVLSVAEQRVIADGFYGRDSLRVYGGMMQYLMWGAVSAWLMANAMDYAYGVKPGEKSRAQKLVDAPGQWITQAIDKSGVLGMFGNMNNIVEKSSDYGVGTIIRHAAGDKDTSNATLERWKELSRGERIFKSVAGPTLGQAYDLTRATIGGVHAATGGRMSNRDIRTFSQIPPAQNNIFLRRHVLEPANKYLSEDILGMRYK